MINICGINSSDSQYSVFMLKALFLIMFYNTLLTYISEVLLTGLQVSTVVCICGVYLWCIIQLICIHFIDTVLITMHF